MPLSTGAPSTKLIWHRISFDEECEAYAVTATFMSAKRRHGAALLPVGKTSSHPELGPCTVLGQWQFFDDKGAERKWTFLNTQPPVPPAVLGNSDP